MKKERKPRSVTCTHHCAACGGHFGSLRAFDLHLHHDPAGWPWCMFPAAVRVKRRGGGPDESPYEARDGVCRLTRGEVEHSGVVWGDRESAERARSAFA